ncbi:OmpA family protein [Novosphingobium sp.]|uniref:OmpA family protein n=1 Tax=Novosphingobium sp. TaxID=1874826 RepID=UPI00286DFBC0|nr:OmpA family protein [Novosphingobium sp.]
MRRTNIIFGIAAAGFCTVTISSAALAEEPLSQYEQSLACKFSQTCDPATLAPYEAAAQSEEQTLEVGPEAPFKFYRPTTPQGKPQTGGSVAGVSAQGSGPKLFPTRGGGAQDQSTRRPQATGYTAPKPVRKPDRPAYVRKNAADMTLNFENASADVNSRGADEIKAWANVLNSSQFAGKVVRIEGHTNAVGAEDYNRDLSRRRAEAVKQLLISNGVDASRIEAVGLGFDKPRARDPRAEANRRVEIVQAN